ncbi:MAG: flagellar basal body-associated protein FliL [Desulfomicrobiaceae bacterium]|jgi:flagellar FliL protein|nr:flagellar basal body-associated protein FliL [Desulfomicrobiaceae bacterium]
MADKEKKDQTVEEQPKKGGKLKWIIILLVLVALLGAGGFFAYQHFFASSKEGAADANATEEAAPTDANATNVTMPGQLVKLDTLVVNLADPLGRRYLKVTMEVEVVDPQAVAELDAAMPKVKDALLLLLSSKTFADVATMDKKLELKLQVVERLNQILGKSKVRDVYFTEFVVQ